MIISHANLIVDYDPMTVALRTQDTMLYIQSEWNKAHAEPIDVAELHKFLCDEHYGDLTEEQKEFVRVRRDEMRSAYAGMVCQLLLCGEMLPRVVSGQIKRLLFVATGALMSPTSSPLVPKIRM